MSKQLFPKEFINSSLEHYTFKVGKKNSGIYLVVIIAILTAFLSLPFVKVNVTTNAIGTIDTKTQRYDIISPVNGRLVVNRIEENKSFKKGDLLIRVESSELKEELNQISQRLTELQSFIADLSTLSVNQLEEKNLKSNRYKIELLQYQSQLDKLELEKETLKTIYNRQKKLFEQNVIAAVEFDKDEANYNRALSEIELFRKQSLSKWKEASLQFIEEKRSLSLRKKKLENEITKYSLKAPASGELQNVNPISKGQIIQAGQQLAQLTPDTTLMAICWVSPQKVGLLQKGLEGSIKVDAYNYNDWGFLKGKIEEVSSDAYVINNQPFFKVTCSINKSYLQLSNGFIGELKKGMTISGNFNVATRTLYQLLYDKVDNWVNPTTL